MRIKKIHLAVFFCLFQLSTASYADRHGYEQDDDHYGYDVEDDCRSNRSSCNIAASNQSSNSSSSRSGSGYESYSRDGCSEDGDDSHGSNQRESNHNATCAAPVQTSAAVASSVNSRIADSSARHESSYAEESFNDDQSAHSEGYNDWGGSGN